MTQHEGFWPAGRQAKTGNCALCGDLTRLTRAHVPPKAAFNHGSFAWGGTTSDNHLDYGRSESGGAWRYAHCEACRAKTSPWDDEYIKWAHCFAGHLVTSEDRGERTHIVGELIDVRPGRFIRAAIAGMTVLAPNLIDSDPALVRIVREGIPASPPGDLRFLAAIAPDKSHVLLEGSHGASALHVPRGYGRGYGRIATTPTVSAVVHFPPFSLLLADRQLAGTFPHVDCTEMLEFGVDESAAMSVSLPMVDLHAMPDAPVPSAMTRFVEVRA